MISSTSTLTTHPDQVRATPDQKGAMDTIELLKRKYESPPEVEENVEPTRVCEDSAPTENPPEDPDTGFGWKGVVSVKNLAALIRKAPGFRVYRKGNSLGIRFKPGISPSDPDRWELANAALMLLVDAEEDLRRLIDSGALKV